MAAVAIPSTKTGVEVEACSAKREKMDGLMDAGDNSKEQEEVGAVEGGGRGWQRQWQQQKQQINQYCDTHNQTIFQGSGQARRKVSSGNAPITKIPHHPVLVCFALCLPFPLVSPFYSSPAAPRSSFSARRQVAHF